MHRIFVTKRTTLDLSTYLYAETGQEKFKPSRMLRHMVESGENEVFSGKGFFSYPSRAARTLVRRDTRLIVMIRYLRKLERQALLASKPHRRGVA